MFSLGIPVGCVQPPLQSADPEEHRGQSMACYEPYGVDLTIAYQKFPHMLLLSGNFRSLILVVASIPWLIVL